MTIEQAGPGRHPIRVVSRRTGITPSALRAWERRYGAVEPDRSEGGQRIYSEEEVRRLTLLKRAVDGGRSIGQVAGLPDETLEELVREDRRASALMSAAGTAGSGAPAREAEALLEDAVEAVEGMAPRKLREVLRRAVVSLSPDELVDDVLVPLLHWIGEGWRTGELGAAAEHLASTVIRSFLEWLVEAADVGSDAPRMLVATPAGQRHEFGALLAAGAAALSEWNVVFLGPDLPAEEIASAARKVQARTVVLSALLPGEEPGGLADEVERLLARLPSEVEVMVGGAAAEAAREELTRVGATYVPDLQTFRERIRAPA